MQNWQIDKVSLSEKVMTAWCVTAPLLMPYGIVGIDFGRLAFILILIIVIVKDKRLKFYSSPLYISYVIYRLTVPVLLSFVIYGIFSITNTLLFNLIIFCCAIPYINVEFAVKIYKKIALFLCVIFLFQELQYLVMGYRFSGLMPGLPLVYESTLGVDTQSLIEHQINSTRSCSLFLEPAHFAQYLVPALIVSLYGNRGKISFYSIIFSIVLLLLKSGIGLLLLAMVWLVWIFANKISIKKKFVFLTIFLPLIIVSIYYFIKSEYVADLLFRTQEISVDSTSSSGFIRFIRGYLPWLELPLISKIFGIGSSETLEHLLQFMECSWLFHDETYFNSFQNDMIMGGLIGTGCLYFWFTKCVGQVGIQGKLLILSYVVLTFMESMHPLFFVLYISLSNFKRK